MQSGESSAILSMAYPPDSIWNHPLGAEAELVPLNMEIPRDRTLNIEEDILIVAPEAAPKSIIAHDAAWRDGVTRCGSRTGEVLPKPYRFLRVGIRPRLSRCETQPFGSHRHARPDAVRDATISYLP